MPQAGQTDHFSKELKESFFFLVALPVVSGSDTRNETDHQSWYWEEILYCI